MISVMEKCYWISKLLTFLTNSYANSAKIEGLLLTNTDWPLNHPRQVGQ